jgi:quercetin dioxygenase-like cupin family protein
MTNASDAGMAGAGRQRSRLRHVRLDHDSPDLELANGVHARIAMTNQVMISKVVMTAGSSQDERSHRGETVIVVLSGQLSVLTGGERTTLAVDDIAIVPAGERYALIADDKGCTRLDVFTPPDMTLAEEAFHQEHANHGFE